jgi:hypothetical protein
MELLNSEELKNVKGGIADSFAKECTKTGDTIFKKCILSADFIIILCATYEAKCTGSVTYDCGVGDFKCSSGFTLKCIKDDKK